MSMPLSRDRDSGYHRVEAFSDAVIAIILTLIGYDLLGTGGHGSNDLAATLVAAWPAYLAFTLSFLVVGQMWVVHHNFWQMIRVAEQGLLVLNLALLFFIATLPWAAKLIATHLTGNSKDLRLAVSIYAAVALGQAACFNAMLWRARAKQVFDGTVSDARYRLVRRRFWIGPGVYAAALAMAPAWPVASLALFFTAACLYLGLGFVSARSRDEG